MTIIRTLLACLALAATLGLAAGTTATVVGGTAAYAQNGTKGAPNVDTGVAGRRQPPEGG